MKDQREQKMSKQDEEVEVTVDRIEHSTPKAVCVVVDKEKIWLPKSQITVNEDKEPITVTMPEWLATDKGLV